MKTTVAAALIAHLSIWGSAYAAGDPSQYGSFALAEENATLYLNDTIFTRLIESTMSCTPPHLSHDRKVFWLAPFGGATDQGNEGGHPGYDAGTGGVSAGIDYQLCPKSFVGGALGYSGIGFDWKEHFGHTSIDNGYGALYASFISNHGFIFASMLASYNQYDVTRKLTTGSGKTARAKSDHNGFQTSGHLKGGLTYNSGGALFTPFAALDYLYVHENSFKEHGADGYDFAVRRKKSDLLEGELGLRLSRCFSTSTNHIAPSIEFSVIREWRFKGKHITATQSGSSKVTEFEAMNPTESLYSAAAGFVLLLPDEHRTLSFDYKGKWGKHFQDNRLIAQFITHF